MSTFEETLDAALAGDSHFEALGLIETAGRNILYVRTVENAPYGLLAGLEDLLLRAAGDVESHDRLEEVNAVIFYDIEQRQVICNLVNAGNRNYLLAAVAAPNKAYKQATKRLIKTLQDTLGA